MWVWVPVTTLTRKPLTFLCVHLYDVFLVTIFLFFGFREMVVCGLGYS
jgi:hypothetical protein